MHRDLICHVLASEHADFLVSASVDGIVKFWKITPTKLEFVKLFRAHVGAITAAAMSPDGQYMCTCGEDRALKLYDVRAFEMVAMVGIGLQATSAVWLGNPQAGGVGARIAVVGAGSREVHIFEPISGG